MTDRPPFDPARVRRPPPGAPSGPALLTVRQVNDLVAGALRTHLPATLHVLGEISNLSQPGSGHLYFTLKDAQSELRCVLWRSTAVTLRFAPEDGLQVIATGTIEVYAPRGTYQLIVRRLEPRGAGALEIAFRQLRERLEREGLFDPARKRPLPRIPRRVAIVTSPTGAALRDILTVLRRRFPALEVLLFPVRVQGEGAAAEITAAVRLLSARAEELGGIDVAIVGRGGGSAEDLWAFNDEALARAIAASRVPIVSAVGHEVDWTIADYVADLRAPTPTAAAELITPDRRELLAAISRAAERARRAAQHELTAARAHLNGLLAAESLARPLARVRELAQRVDEAQQQAARACAALARRAREALLPLEATLLRWRSGAPFALRRQRIVHLLYDLARGLHRRSLALERRWALLRARLEYEAPGTVVATRRARTAHLAERCAAALRSRLSAHRARLAALQRAADLCHPRHVLGRGFSLTRDARSGTLIRHVRDVRAGQLLRTELADGEIRSTAHDPRQPGLFD